MAGFSGIKGLVDAQIAGNTREYSWRKNTSAVNTASLWFDISMSPGIPAAKFWFDSPPLVAKAISQSTDGGIFHGANLSPSEAYISKFISQSTASTPLPLVMIVCDYLLYYPTLADDTTDEQVLTNSVTLPRYADGEGVQIMLVSLAARTGGGTLTVNYTNSDGVAGRVSGPAVLNSAAAVGTIANSERATANGVGPFIGLQSGDRGVRSVESVTMSIADSGGLFAVLLVKPLFQTLIRGIDAPVEKDLLIQSASLPRIYDDAFISFICLPQGILSSSNLTGSMKIIHT